MATGKDLNKAHQSIGNLIDTIRKWEEEAEFPGTTRNFYSNPRSEQDIDSKIEAFIDYLEGVQHVIKKQYQEHGQFTK